MSSIGPQLPPHLAKRKRTPDDEGADSPPAKQSRNTDEIDLEDDSDNDSFSHSVKGRATVAAAASRPSPSSTPSIGAALLPSNPTNTSEIPLDDSDSEDGYGPSAPRITSTAEVPKNKPSIGPAPPPKQTIGPAMPPPNHRGADDDNNSSSDSDDDYGPALPSSTTSAQRVQAAAAAAAAQASAGPVAPQRDDWMLAPPTQSGYHERDPTKLKNRKFASSKSSTAAGGGAGGISSIWTETPEQKRKRLEDAVLGRGDATSAAGPQQPRRTKEEEERDRRISENIATARGRSMYEEHQRSKKGGVSQCKGEEEEDDPSKRAFDREKDMSLGGKIGTAQRKELLNRAKDFGGRFQKGSYL